MESRAVIRDDCIRSFQRDKKTPEKLRWCSRGRVSTNHEKLEVHARPSTLRIRSSSGRYLRLSCFAKRSFKSAPSMQPMNEPYCHDTYHCTPRMATMSRSVGVRKRIGQSMPPYYFQGWSIATGPDQNLADCLAFKNRGLPPIPDAHFLRHGLLLLVFPVLPSLLPLDAPASSFLFEGHRWLNTAPDAQSSCACPGAPVPSALPYCTPAPVLSPREFPTSRTPAWLFCSQPAPVLPQPTAPIHTPVVTAVRCPCVWPM